MKKIKTNAVKTVLVISVGFGIVFLWLDANWALYASLTIGILGIISNRISKIIDALWMKLAKVLSYIVPNILLAIVFYVFLFPIAVLSKIFGNKSSFILKNKRETIWVKKSTPTSKASFEKMW